MNGFAPQQLAAWTGGHWTQTPAGGLTGFTIDSRQAEAGQVFVALRTGRRDGHDFLAAAQAAGAAAALVTRANPAVTLPQLVVADTLRAFQAVAREHRRGFPGKVIGVSGSAGKTSTKNLLARLLSAAPGDVLATVGNLNNHLGVPLTLTRLDAARHRFAVVEAGISAPGEMRPLADMISPDAAVITLVAEAHMAALGSIEGVAREKAVLPAAVRSGGFAIYPGGCEAFAAFRELGVNRVIVERAEAADAAQPEGERVRYTTAQQEGATVIKLGWNGRPLVLRMPRVSEGMAQNAVLAVVTALRLGVAPEEAERRLRAWAPAAMRGELRREGARWLYVDCYNANPASMADALDAFAGLAPADEPRLYILGGMEELGAAAEMLHRALGRALPLRAEDELFAVGDHSAAVVAGAREAGLSAARLHASAGLDEARARLAEFSGAVFLKGSRRYRLETLLEREAAHA